jgi:hypothetical protein
LALSWWRIAGMGLTVLVLSLVQMVLVIESYGRAKDQYERNRETRVAVRLVLMNAALVALTWLGAQSYYCPE